MTSLVDKLVPDDLWALVEPLLPPPPRPPYGGRHRTIPERNCLAALVFMARTSTPWALLPAKELGCGSSSTAWGWPAGWTGRAPAWTPPACAPNEGGSRWRESRRSRQAGVQAPSGQRAGWPAADRRGHRCQRQ